jgi:hypothetical protein
MQILCEKCKFQIKIKSSAHVYQLMVSSTCFKFTPTYKAIDTAKTTCYFVPRQQGKMAYFAA